MASRSKCTILILVMDAVKMEGIIAYVQHEVLLRWE